MDRSPITAIVLAAGRGARFSGDGSKLVSDVGGGETLAARAVRHALEADIGPVIVVVGAVAVDLLRLDPAAAVTVNPRWAEGQATSLQAGIAHAAASGADAVVLGLGDQPDLTTEAWRAVASAPAALAVATYGGRRGHPVRLGSAVWADLPTAGDEGARHLLQARAAEVVEVPCDGDCVDIDTIDDLDRWRVTIGEPAP